LTVTASASGCHDDSKTQNTANTIAIANPGQGRSSDAIATPAPIAHTCSVRGRPKRTSARWPHAGTAIVNPIAPTDAITPISPGLNPKSWRTTAMNG
jgi:hypothetical protein